MVSAGSTIIRWFEHIKLTFIITWTYCQAAWVALSLTFQYRMQEVTNAPYSLTYQIPGTDPYKWLNVYVNLVHRTLYLAARTCSLKPIHSFYIEFRSPATWVTRNTICLGEDRFDDSEISSIALLGSKDSARRFNPGLEEVWYNTNYNWTWLGGAGSPWGRRRGYGNADRKIISCTPISLLSF